MTISDDLFQLIKSLGQAEKRYFKLFAKLHVKGDINNYVLLFDVIERQKEYDEAYTIKKLKIAGFTKQFSVAKNYLYNSILKALRSYHTSNDIETKINDEIHSIKILFGKGLYKKSLQRLKKIKKLAWKFEKVEHLFMILNWEDEITYRCSSPSEWYRIQELLQKEKEQLFAIIENKYEFHLLEDEITHLYRLYPVIRSDSEKAAYKRVIKNPLLKKKQNAFSHEALSSYHNIMAINHTINDRFTKAIKHDKAKHDYFVENPHMRDEHLTRFIGSLNNLIIGYLELNMIDQFHDALEQMRELPSHHPNMTETQRAIIFETTYNLELGNYFDNNQLEKALSILPEMETGLKRYGQIMLPDFKNEILFNISKTLYYSGNNEKARIFLDQIIYDDKAIGAEDIHCFARIMNLMIHFDLGFYELLKHEIKATQRFMIKMKRLYKAEKLILKNMLRLVSHSENNKKSILLKFKKEFEELAKDPYEEHAQSFLNILSWINSHLESKPISIILKEKVLKKQKKQLESK